MIIGCVFSGASKLDFLPTLLELPSKLISYISASGSPIISLRFVEFISCCSPLDPADPEPDAEPALYDSLSSVSRGSTETTAAFRFLLSIRPYLSP